MTLSQTAIAALYFWGFVLGVGLGAIYDLLRITRVLLGVHYSRRTAERLRQISFPLLPPVKKRGESRARGIVVFREDLFFCLFAGAAFVLLFYGANNGKFRFPVLLLAGVGFLVYRATLGRLLMMFSEMIAFFIEILGRYAVFFVSYPIRKVSMWTVGRIRHAAAVLVASRRKKIRRRLTAIEAARMPKNACGLIPDEMPTQRMPKRGKAIVKREQKTVQPHTARAGAAGNSGRHVHRRIRKQRDAL